MESSEDPKEAAISRCTDCPTKCKVKTITDFFWKSEAHPSDAGASDPCLSLLDAGDNELEVRCTED